MIDIEKQVAYWRDGAIEAWGEVPGMIHRGRTSFALYFLHLALEKALKAHVCRQTNDLAPRIHDLAKLAHLARLSLSEEQLDVLADANSFNLAGRYADISLPPPSHQQATSVLHRTQEVFAWLINQL